MEADIASGKLLIEIDEMLSDVFFRAVNIKLSSKSSWQDNNRSIKFGGANRHRGEKKTWNSQSKEILG